MAQIAQLVLASVALLVVLQTCQARQRYTLGNLCVDPLYIMHCCTSYVHAVFATSVSVGSNPIGPPQVSRTRRTTSVGGRDAAGTGEFLTLLA